MKPTPISSVRADDLLLDRVGARLDTDDELGWLLLSMARGADDPIGRPLTAARRARRHRGLTVLAALGVAVSGATVAAALEPANTTSSASAADAARNRLLPQALQSLGLPFAATGPLQGRFARPGGVGPLGTLLVPVSGTTATATGIPGDTAAMPYAGPGDPSDALTPSGEQSDGTTSTQAQGKEGSKSEARAAGDTSGGGKAGAPQPTGTPQPNGTADPTPAASQTSAPATPPGHAYAGLANGGHGYAGSGNAGANGNAFAGSGNAGQANGHTPAPTPTPTPTPTAERQPEPTPTQAPTTSAP